MNIEIGCAYPIDGLYANVRRNSLACSDWLTQLDAHEGHAVIVGGGPSLAAKLPLLQRRISSGQTIFALNGAGKFLNENGIIPDYQVFLDANLEMGDRVGTAKRYLVSSQCAPELLECLKGKPVTLWHFALPMVEDHLPVKDESLLVVGGGCTVGLTSMCLVYAMGYRKLHLFGYDSSNKAGRDHAYSVPLTEEKLGDQILNSVSVTYGDKTFETTLAMAYQAEIFPYVCNELIDRGCIITNDSEGLIMAVMDEIRNSNAAALAA